MHYRSIMDDCSSLNNYKNRHGLNIQSSSTASIYIKQRKLTRLLDSILVSYVKDRMDRAKYVDWIVFKCEDSDLIDKVTYIFENEENIVVSLMKENLKKFWKYIKNYDS